MSMASSQVEEILLVDHLSPNSHKLDQDRLRDLNQRYKWQFGEESPRVGRLSPRPQKPINSPLAYVHKLRGLAKATDGCVAPDEETDSDEEAGTTATGQDPYMYSHDASTGPSSGSDVLSQAIAKAEDKYETKVVEKLIKDEYEIVCRESVDMAVDHRLKRDKSRAKATKVVQPDPDDDFELV